MKLSTNRRGALLALLFLALLAWRYSGRIGEDFVYYYCAGESLRAGQTPYRAGPYHACIGRIMPINPVGLSGIGSAYPPYAMPLFKALAGISYGKSFLLWSLALLAASLILGKEFFARRGAAMILLFTWPGFILSWAYHKAAIPVFALFWTGLALASEPGLAMLGGAVLGFCALAPQWLAAGMLYLMVRGNRRAFLGACATGLIPLLFSLGLKDGQLWLASAALHSGIATFDNQSLLFLFYRLLGPWPHAWTRPLQISLFIALMIPACLAVYKKKEKALPLFLGAFLLAEPYSHASDTLWAFPLFLAVLASIIPAGLPERRAKLFLAGFAFNAAWALLSGGYAPDSLASPLYQSRQSVLALILLASEPALGAIYRRVSGGPRGTGAFADSPRAPGG